MPRFTEVTRFNHPALEEEILAHWKKQDIFQKSISRRDGAPAFTFFEGPPTANGRPGIHHVMARAIKDIFCRFKTMKGYRVERKAGWDTHGLPVEIEVEKELGLESRAQVEEYGIKRYNAACRESVLRYTDLWNSITERMGYWVDLEHPYITFENEYIESVWWLLKQIHEKGLLYKGYKIQWYSPGSGTVLSSHEVSLGYEEVQDPSVYVRFPVTDEKNTFFLAWTTTPWTLVSNTALAVKQNIQYVKIRHNVPHGGEEYLILAEDLLEVIQEEYEIVDRFRGVALLGKRYKPVFSTFAGDVDDGKAWRVVEADFVSTDDGTGIVHMAPAFGADDFAVGKKEGLPLLNPIDAEGRFTEKMPLVAGMWFKDADPVLARDLRDRGLMYRHETYLHNYPHDWRKGTPLMSYPVESWFIRTTAVKERMIELNKTINWQPKGIGTGRFGEWLENNIDWALSRRRYWGTPLPVWENDNPDSDYIEVVGSVAELREKCGEQLPEGDDLDLHRPYVDDFTWPAPESEGGGTMRRVEDLIDVWFDSGAMPFAQWHYPFENEDLFEQNFPGDFIAEGVDQTRGWFYTLHAIATLVSDGVAYKNVVVNGLVLDENGEKMSKSKGNAVDPFATIAEYGADVVRWYMMSNTPPWENIKFSERGLRDTQRKFFSTLENCYSFFATYANIDGFQFQLERMPLEDRTELDRWIMSRLNSTIRAAEEAYTDYDPTKAARAVERFVEELSNWYIRRSRRRFWANKSDIRDAAGKEAAYQTTCECLETVSRLMAPLAPFFGDWLYRSLTEVVGREAQPSVHLADFPNVADTALDAGLEHRMGLARTITSVVLSLRNAEEINVRQPLPRILIVTGPEVEQRAIKQVRGIILDEVNVKDIEYVSGASDVVIRSARPNFRRLGKRLGPLMKLVNAKVQGLDDDAIGAFLQEGRLLLSVEGEKVELGEGDLDIVSEGIEGWVVGQEGRVTVALDTELTDELRHEGLVRECVSRVQNMRREADFDITDRIRVKYDATDTLARALEQHAAEVRNETLAVELEKSSAPSGERVEAYVIGDEKITLGVSRV